MPENFDLGTFLHLLLNAKLYTSGKLKNSNGSASLTVASIIILPLKSIRITYMATHDLFAVQTEYYIHPLSIYLGVHDLTFSFKEVCIT